MKEEKVVLVNKTGDMIGVKEKLQAHQDGDLHLALSVFLFNHKGEWLLQKRAPGKYHSPGLWSNACCSHPRPSEGIVLAAKRRLYEEMGITCDIKKFFNHLYRADVGKGLIEHEFDHLFYACFDGKIDPNPEEVADWKWSSMEEIEKELSSDPHLYTSWFHLFFPLVKRNLEKRPIW